MARIRSIKPEIWLSPQVMNLAHGARLLFIGLITQADDEGRGTADPRRLKAAIFGGDDDVTTLMISGWLDAIGTERLATFYDGNGHGALYELTSWRNHQSIDRPRKSNYPAPPAGRNSGTVVYPLGESSASVQRSLDESSTTTREGSEGSEGRKDLRTRARAVDHDPVDNSGTRALAPERLKKQPDRKSEIERNREAARAIARNLAAAAKP